LTIILEDKKISGLIEPKNLITRNKVTKKKVMRIIIPLLVSGAVAAIILSLVKDYVQYKEIYEDVAAWSAFFSVFGIVYAIVAGFLLVTVLSKYSDLSQAIENELNAIETVRDFFNLFRR
jgi:uncharacterized membrane protein